MSKKKTPAQSKNRKSNKVTRLPKRRAHPSKQILDRNLAEVIKEMALRLLKKPDSDAATEPATMARKAEANRGRPIGDKLVKKMNRYVQSKVIFLEGLPDIPESRPHSSVNS